MKTKLSLGFLLVSGLILLGIGSAILVMPEAFHAGNGITLGSDASLLSEIRAPGGLLAASGFLIVAGAFRRKLRSRAIFLATLVYGSFGLSRLLGMTLDGMPSKGIVGATALELIVAMLGILILGWQSHASALRPSSKSTTATVTR